MSETDLRTPFGALRRWPYDIHSFADATPLLAAALPWSR
jgi:hypothetical protein